MHYYAREFSAAAFLSVMRRKISIFREKIEF